MKSVFLPSSRQLELAGKPRLADGVARRLVMNRLQGLQSGQLALAENGREVTFGSTVDDGLASRIEVLNPRFFSEVAFGGSIGAGEAYMQGLWTCTDLVALVRIFLRNRNVLESMESGAVRLTTPLRKMLHWINRNTREGARRNIAAHYDLGNDFFALWLDPTMMYSCAMFTRPGMNLHQAQLARLEHICQKLQLCRDDHVMEVGTGWGGFAEFAARNYGCRVTTTTISEQQFEMASQRVAAAGLQGRVTVLLEDFRDLRGQYDKLVSIEMIEAIGSSLYEAFFRQCSKLLKPDGLMLLQAITIADQNYSAALKSVDFIQRHIFPGGCLPSSAVMIRTVAEKTDMRLLALLDIGLHYATTLRCWRRNFFTHIDRIRSLGYPPSFVRMWEFYLCYCEGAFLERAISDVQLVFSKPAFRRPLNGNAS